MARPSKPTSGLGRGLASLIPTTTPVGEAPTEIPLDRIRTNPYQPRRYTNEVEIAQLAASIREHGVLQPILVTETLDGFELVAGERRVRAARLAGLTHIPAVVRELPDRHRLELALVENLQREDLNPIEEALGYRRLIDEFGFTQEEIAARVAKARSTVANTLRLLDQPAEIQDAVAEGRLSEGHARAIAGLPADDQRRLAALVVAKGLNVRQTEELARRLRAGEADVSGGADSTTSATSLDPVQQVSKAVALELARVQEDLQRALGTKVRIARGRRGGRIVIEYYSDEELGRLYDRLVGGGA
ncbi:MAG TPA: ParB/RepB/Spo0J family partition protein [Candidatus Binatia bacterium]|nr:ParB/RepB/Spo0J family partition protein [Candidatus Binatia bacterium]